MALHPSQQLREVSCRPALVTHFAPTATATHGRGRSANSFRTASTSHRIERNVKPLRHIAGAKHSATRQ